MLNVTLRDILKNTTIEATTCVTNAVKQTTELKQSQAGHESNRKPQKQ